VRDRHDVHLRAFDRDVEDVVHVGDRGEQVQSVIAAREGEGRAAGIQYVRDDVAYIGPMGTHDVEHGDVVARLEELVHDVGPDEASSPDHAYTHDGILLDNISSRA
jgi:hypothetical protein